MGHIRQHNKLQTKPQKRPILSRTKKSTVYRQTTNHQHFSTQTNTNYLEFPNEDKSHGDNNRSQEDHQSKKMPYMHKSRKTADTWNKTKLPDKNKPLVSIRWLSSFVVGGIRVVSVV